MEASCRCLNRVYVGAQECVNEIFKTAAQLSTFEGLAKIASVAKPLVEFIGLLMYGLDAKVKMRIVDDLEGLKSVKSSVAWFTQVHVFSSHNVLKGGYRAIVARMSIIALSILGLIEFIDRNITNRFSGFIAIKGIAFSWGGAVDKAIPLKLAIAALHSLNDLAINLPQLICNLWGKKSFIQMKKQVLENREINTAVQEIYDTKMQDLQDEINGIFKRNAELAAANCHITERMQITKNHKDWSGIRKYTIGKELKKAVDPDISLDDNLQHYDNARALMDMNDDQFENYKIARINISERNLPAKNVKLAINVAVSALKVISLCTSMGSIVLGVEELGRLFNTTKYKTACFEKGLSAFVGLMDLGKLIYDIKRKYAPVPKQNAAAAA